MVPTLLLVSGACLFLLQHTSHAKSFRAELIDDGILKLKNTHIVVPKEQLPKDTVKEKFFKQFADKVDYHAEGFGQRRTDVSFSVYISGGLSLNHFEPIKFNHIVENVGDCYKIATGMFEAPIAGLYNFTVSWVYQSRKGVNVHLVDNGHRLTAAHTEFNDKRRIDTYYVLLHRNSAVSVQPDNDDYREYDRAIHFSGKLMVAL